ncbi:MAG: c-type cytochrome [Gemmatimonadales bacterium]|nr:c-type cytochrome [Gemmatimonadales bacterium]
MTRWRMSAIVGAAFGLVACGQRAPEPVAVATAAWAPPSDSAIPEGPLGISIRRGRALLIDTHDSLPSYATSSLNCTSCHLDGGRRANAAPLTGVHGRFPAYLSRAGAVVSLEDRVNYCFTRSLSGNRLPSDSREMQDIIAYLAFLSHGAPSGAPAPAPAIAGIPVLQPDPTAGKTVYTTVCASCHGADGAGIGGAMPRAPALWGPRSYSIGASMARVERAASFIRHNMPFGAPGTLTDQQAWDVAAYIDAQPRPDMPGKDADWPSGGAPDDVPYATAGRTASMSPPLLPRATPERAMVPPPPSVRPR